MEEIFKERPGLGIILQVIRDKIREKEERIKSVRQSAIDEIEKSEKIISMLENFEKKHLEELNDIYPGHLQHYYNCYFLFSPINELNCLIYHNREMLDNPDHFCHGPNGLPQSFDGYSFPITLSDFEELTGISHKNIKVLIFELERRDLIARKRVVGGYVYAIKANKV